MGRGRGRDYSYMISPEGLEVEIVEKSLSFPELLNSESSFEVVYNDKVPFVDCPVGPGRVRFAESNEYFTVHSRDDLSPEERRDVWFRKSELKQMRKEFEARSQNRVEELDSEQEPPQNDELQEALHQLMALSVVLDEQRRQRDENLSDPDTISEKYQTFVRRSRHSMFIANLVREQEKKQVRGRPLRLLTDAPVLTDADSLR